MRNLLKYLGLAVMTSGAAACAAASDDSTADDGVATADLVTAGVKSIEVSRSAGFAPPPPPGGCHPSGHWTFDFVTRTLAGNACVAAHPVEVNKVLSVKDAARVRSALSKVRVTAPPSACPTDMPVSALTVERAHSELHYIDARAACGGAVEDEIDVIPVIAVRETTLQGLVGLLEELSTPVAAACMRTGCSGEICSDRNTPSICVMRPEYACYDGATCERGADGECGFRETPELTTCLANVGQNGDNQ